MSGESNNKADIQFLQDRFDAIGEGNDYAGSPAWHKDVYHNNNFPVPFAKFLRHNIRSEHTEHQMRVLVEDYWAGRDTDFVTACKFRLGLTDDDLLVLHDNGECPLPIERYGRAMYERGIRPYTEATQ